MDGRIKYSEFVKFDFLSTVNEQVPVNCIYSFEAQAPQNTQDVIRAIVVNFSADSPNDAVHFRARCRVVFDLTDVGTIPDENEFIDSYYKAAYQEFCNRANEIIVAMRQNPFGFQDI